MLYGHEEDQLATPADAVREWVSVVGANHPNRAWLCHDYDVWVANPYYNGPPVRHPEDYDMDADVGVVNEQDLLQGDYVAAIVNDNGEFDDRPF